MGLIIFIIASGLTLVFGLMDVLNFGHGVFIALGAFVATSVMGGMADWSSADSLARNLVAVGCAMLVAMIAAGLLGLAFERVIVRPVYGLHLKQILITMGGMIVGEELIKVVWGRSRSRCRCRRRCAGFVVGDASIEKYRVLAVAIGPVVFGCCCSRSTARRSACSSAPACRTARWSSPGYRIRRLFVGVFVAGSALAGPGAA